LDCKILKKRDRWYHHLWIGMCSPIPAITVKLKLIDSASFKRLAILIIIIAAILIFGWSLMVWMPGVSYRQALPMGSFVYAQAAKQRGDTIVGMFGLETLGYFTDTAQTQKYPLPLSLLYPDRGNFIGFVSDIDSRELLRNTIRSFRAQAQFPSEGAALPSMIQGVGSDSRSFWQQGYQALMITDTAPFRYPQDRTDDDTIAKINLEQLSRVTYGISKVIRDFVGLPSY
jgi:hypothetical protein